MEAKRQEDLDTIIMETKEKLEVSGTIDSQAQALRVTLPSREMTPVHSPPTALSLAFCWHPGQSRA